MNNNLDKVLKAFTTLWIFTAIGLFVGVFIPIVLILPISILTIILLLVAIFTRSNIKLNKYLVFLISFLLGVTLYSAITFYIGALGGSIVLLVFGTCVVMFIGLGLFGYKSSKDFSSLGKFLFIALLGLVVFSFIALFVQMSNIIMLITSAFGVIIFVGYTIYDFNNIAKNGVDEEDIYMTALYLQLDFINLLLQLLKLVYYLKEILED